VFLGITFFQVVAPFLLPLFLAGVVTILSQPVFRYFLRKTNNRVRIAAGLTTAGILASLMIPFVVGTFIASVQLFTLAHDTMESGKFHNAVRAIKQEIQFNELLDRANSIIPLGKNGKGLSDEEIDQIAENLRSSIEVNLTALAQKTMGVASKVAGTTVNTTIGLLGTFVSFMVSLLMFTIALYYFLADGPALITATKNLVPVNAEYQQQLLNQFDKVIRAVIMATFLAAIAQGLATSLALFVVGFHHFFILFIIATFASLIPMAGTWLVWGPCAIWLAFQGNWYSAVFLFTIGSTVIGFMDNIIRTYVLQSDAKLHPLLAFVSVMGGLQVMGLWGIFIGPMVASCLHALVQIFNTELKAFSEEKFGPMPEQINLPEKPNPAIESTPQKQEAAEAQPAKNEAKKTAPAEEDSEKSTKPKTPND